MLHQSFAIFALVILLFVSIVVAGGEADSDQVQATCRESAERGRDFLVKLVDSEVNLLPEFRGHHVYWLYHDNYLVTKVLEKSNLVVATAIRKAIEKRGENQSGKIEILLVNHSVHYLFATMIWSKWIVTIIVSFGQSVSPIGR